MPYLIYDKLLNDCLDENLSRSLYRFKLNYKNNSMDNNNIMASLIYV